MTLNQLRYFCTASRCRSVTGAAAELFVTQPAVSLAIKDLENEFGVTLFYRQGNTLMLTDEGERIYEKATYILEYCNEMEADITGIASKRTPVRIGIPPVFGAFFFPSLFDEFTHLHPDIKLQLAEYGSVRAADMVQNDELDVSIVNMEMYDIDRFNRSVLRKDQVVYFVSPSHPLADRSVVTTEDIVNERIILLNGDSVQNQLLKQRFTALGLKPDIILQSSQLHLIKKFIETGTCGSFLFGSLKEIFPDFIAIPLDPPVPVNIGMIWKKGKYITAQTKTFMDFAIKSRGCQ
ncbi:MAG: LysR family transcriptional regulator [Bullifex sp.]